MWDTIRESCLGQIARYLFRQQSLIPYPEELASFQLPAGLSSSQSTFLDYKFEGAPRKREEERASSSAEQSVFFSTGGTSTPDEPLDVEAGKRIIPRDPSWLSTGKTAAASAAGSPTISPSSSGASPSPALASPTEPPRDDAEKQQQQEPVLVVDWYDGADAANPQNWSLGKKIWITVQMGLYTFAVYVGSSLYAPSETQVMEFFGVSYSASALGIALYVIGYGLGPLLFSPLSEIPRIGRTNIYIATFFVFVLLALGASVVNSFGGLLALRFLLGFFGSPCLATAGATLDDMFAPWKLPYVLTVWSSSATLAPALGPIVSGFAVSAMGWRFSNWELFWLAAPVWLLMFVGLPETHPDTILHRRAMRLRALMQQPSPLSIQCEAELKRAHMTARQVAVDALIKPWEINALDPAVLYTTVYSAVLYGTYYSFFEAFPLVFGDIYGFNLGESGLPFLAFVPGLLIAVPGYIIWFWLKAEPVMHKEPPPLYGHPESRLFPAVATTFLVPAGLFIFGER
ncbi:hypothetical protein AAE478_002158 [Parahypoxylon ruwenzoriense]